MTTITAKFREAIDAEAEIWTLSTPGSTWQHHNSGTEWVENSSYDTLTEAIEAMFAVIFFWDDTIVVWIGWTEDITETWAWREEDEAETDRHCDLGFALEAAAAANPDDFTSVNVEILKDNILEQVQERIDDKREAAGLPVHEEE